MPGTFFIMITQYDKEKKRCPMLGHDIGFDYCRQPGQEIPCRKIFDCWYEKFDIVEFIKQEYGGKMVQKIQTPPKPKMQSLLDLIEQAKKANSKD